MENPLAQALEKHVRGEGMNSSAIPGLMLMKSYSPKAPIPIIYRPSIYLVAQGEKRAWINERSFSYDAMNYLVLTLPLPLHAGVMQASEEKPFLAMRQDIDLQLLGEVYAQMQPQEINTSVPSCAIFSSPVDDNIYRTMLDLVNTLDSEEEIRILAPLKIKTLYYYLLKGPQAHLLLHFLQAEKHSTRIAASIDYIHQHFAQTLNVDTLSQQANMSPSAYFQHFKQVTQVSPLQYIKQIRLHKARYLLQSEKITVSETAYWVGYASLSQFSREYKRLFGLAPLKELKSGQAS